VGLWVGVTSDNSLGKNGGDDETRTRDLCRDSSLDISIFNDLEEHGRHLSHCKYAQDEVIVYRSVYHATLH